MNGGSLDSVIQVFDGEICRYEEHPENCIEAANTWWPVISKIIFSNAAARKVCSSISGGTCEARKYVILSINSQNLPHSSRTLLHNGVNFRCLCIAKHFSLKSINYYVPRINFVPKNCIVEDQNKFALINITHNWEALKLEPVVNKKTEKRTQVLSKSN